MDEQGTSPIPPDTNHVDYGDTPILQIRPHRLVQHSDALALVLALIVGVLLNLSIQNHAPSVATLVAFAIAPLALLVSGRVKSRASRIALIIAPLFAIPFGFRRTEWLIAADYVAVVGLIALAALWSRGPAGFPKSLVSVIQRGLSLFAQAVYAPKFLLEPALNTKGLKSSTSRSILIGIAIALPIVVILGGLLASADTVFASFISFDFTLGDMLLHVLVSLLMAWVFAIALRTASSEVDQTDRERRKLIGATESITALSLILALFGLFVLTQILLWTGGADDILKTAGLSYAEHARRGFFQLIAVSALTFAVLIGFRTFMRDGSTRQRQIWRFVSLATIALSLVIVSIAIQRLFLYEDAYGLTVARVVAIAGAVWIGLILVMLAITFLQRQRDVGQPEHRWLFVSVIGSGLVVLLLLNIANPERMVVERNWSRVGKSAIPFDAAYVGTLSADGIAAFKPHFNKLNEAEKRDFLNNACPYWGEINVMGGLSYNASQHEADTFLKDACKDHKRTGYSFRL